MFWPCETTTSTCRNFATISSGVYRFFGIAVLLHVKRHSSGRTTSKGDDHYPLKILQHRNSATTNSEQIPRLKASCCDESWECRFRAPSVHLDRDRYQHQTRHG